jgi:pilus assembly protein FimV
LRVSIPVTDLAASGVSIEWLRVDVPGHREHEALGFPEPIMPAGLQARVVADERGRARIELRSASATREPILRFLVRAQWPGGTTVREYQLLIDPPSIVYSRPAPAPVSRARRDARSFFAPGLRPSGPAVAGTRYGPVGIGDTLSAIVAEAYPDAARDAERIARVVVARNPRAFVGGDPNRVMLGATLDLPSLASLRSDTAPRAPASAPGPEETATATGATAYTVRPGDTLYAIARRSYGADGATLAAAVDRLFENNPQAFVSGDPDRLRVGAVLALHPAPSAEVRAPQTVATARSTSQPQAVTPEPVSAETVPATVVQTRSGTEAPAAAGASDEPQAAALREEIAAVQAVVDAERARGAQMQARLDGLLDEVSVLRDRETRLTEQADRLAEQVLARQAAAAPLPVVRAEPGTVPAAASSSAQPAPATTQPAAPASATPSAAAPAVAPRAAVPVRRAASQAREGSGWSRLSSAAQESVLIGLLALLVVAGLGFALWRVVARRRAVLLAHSPAYGLQPGEQATHTARRQDPGEDETRQRLSELRDQHAGAGAARAHRAAGAGDGEDDNVVLTDAAQANKLAKEAAVHMAYGDHDACKACIMEAIRLDPHRDEHKMVLLTLYESIGQQHEARAILEDLLARREQLSSALRDHVERQYKELGSG